MKDTATTVNVALERTSYTNTTMFLRHILGEDMIGQGLRNFYLGEGRELFAIVTPGSYADTFMTSHAFFVKRLDGDVIVLNIEDEKLYSDVYLPFKQGKYSKISRDYVNKNFPEFRKSDGQPSVIRKILDRDETTKENTEKKFAFVPPTLGELEVYLEEKGIAEENRVRYRRLFRSSMETFSRTLSPQLDPKAEVFSRPKESEYLLVNH